MSTETSASETVNREGKKHLDQRDKKAIKEVLPSSIHEINRNDICKHLADYLQVTVLVLLHFFKNFHLLQSISQSLYILCSPEDLLQTSNYLRLYTSTEVD